MIILVSLGQIKEVSTEARAPESTPLFFSRLVDSASFFFFPENGLNRNECGELAQYG